MSCRKRLTSIFAAIFIFILLAAGFIRQRYVLPILMYHTVYPGASYTNRLSVSTDTFERQMCFLKKHRYNILFLEEAADLIRNKKQIPLRTVVLTFDDGYKDNYTYVFPILKKYGIKATIFIIVDEVGRPQGDRLDWNEIKEMQASGLIVFGSHCLGPEPLINIKSKDEIKRQIFESKKILEKELARPVNVFSYPEGRFNSEIRQYVIDAGYKAAVATSPGKNHPNDDVFALKRIRISENAKNLFVFWIESSGFYTFIKEHRHK